MKSQIGLTLSYYQFTRLHWDLSFYFFLFYYHFFFSCCFLSIFKILWFIYKVVWVCKEQFRLLYFSKKSNAYDFSLFYCKISNHFIIELLFKLQFVSFMGFFVQFSIHFTKICFLYNSLHFTKIYVFFYNSKQRLFWNLVFSKVYFHSDIFFIHRIQAKLWYLFDFLLLCII